FHLEGRSCAEVAQELGCAVGTVESWLTRARARLRAALARRGLAPASAVLAGLVAEEGGVPRAAAAAHAALAASRGVAGAVSAEASALAAEVVRALGMARLRLLVVVLLLAGAVAGTAAVVAGMLRRPEPPPPDLPGAAQRNEERPRGPVRVA